MVTNEDLTVSVARVEAKLDSLTTFVSRSDTDISGKILDHENRLRAQERLSNRFMGALALAGALGGIVGFLADLLFIAKG